MKTQQLQYNSNNRTMNSFKQDNRLANPRYDFGCITQVHKHRP